ncbi:unnamed protein product [Rotaria socialis]|uniref:Uncharacterized protein n=1 Tax=Rotaria socialis TaxID=392032 RepID=A0A818ENC1_9BILA|nr:unnamed protein product [Rotaria socialis]CAF3513943.1 unnamed protein product [Rotaria socialis]
MRPVATCFKKKATARRKNHQHWSRHKHEISAKRTTQTLTFQQAQFLNENQCEDNGLNINDTLNFLSINETINGINTECSDENDCEDDSINKYFVDTGERGVSFDTFYEDQFEEEIDEEEIEETLTEEQTEFANEFMNVETSATPVREYDELDISIILLIMKKKHKCSNSLINDILKMLITLKVPRVPASWYKLTEIIKRTDDTSKSNQQIIDSTCYFCPECEQESTNPSKCTNAKCSYYSNCLVAPHTFMVMNIQQQIEEVLRSTHQNDLDLSAQTSTESTTSLIDIHNGDVYKNIVHSLRKENHKFLYR